MKPVFPAIIAATAAPVLPYPHQDVVRRALFERTLSGVRWDDSYGKKFLILSDASAQRLGVPAKVEVAPDVAAIIEKTIAAADREELRLRKYIERFPENARITPLRILLPDYADDELKDIAAKHGRDPERRAAYAAMPQVANRSRRVLTIEEMEDIASANKAAQKAANERTSLPPREPEPVRRREDDNKPDPRFDMFNLDHLKDRGRPLTRGIHPKLDEYLLVDAKGDDAAHRLVAEQIVANREAARAARKLTREDQARIKADSQYNPIAAQDRAVSRRRSIGENYHIDHGLSRTD